MKKKFRFMAWVIDLRISKKSADERILYFANRLYDEVEASGRSTRCNGVNMRSVDIYNHTDGSFGAENRIAEGCGWRVEGKRAYE